MIGIGHKSVTRAAPEVKRTVCKGCHTLLVPGDSAKVNVRSRRGGKKLEIRESHEKNRASLACQVIIHNKERLRSTENCSWKIKGR